MPKGAAEQMLAPDVAVNRRGSRKQAEPHGYNAYASGRCKCREVCKPAKRDYERARRAQMLIDLQADGDDPRHGMRQAYDAGCRCRHCRQARWIAGYTLGEYTGERGRYSRVV